MKKLSLSIIIPCFNEENSIGYVLSDTLENLPKVISDFEIIVVDNGSTDKTFEIVKSIAKSSKHIKILHQPNKSFGSALITGIKSAKKDYVAHMQGNGQDLVRDMINCFKIMGEHDLILGVRGKRIDYDFYRFVVSYGGLFLYRLLFNIKYEDVHWTYVWKTSEIKKVKLDPDGGIFTLVQSLILFRKRGLRIGEATSPYRPRFAGVSKTTNLKAMINTLISMFKFWWREYV